MWSLKVLEKSVNFTAEKVYKPKKRTQLESFEARCWPYCEPCTSQP